MAAKRTLIALEYLEQKAIVEWTKYIPKLDGYVIKLNNEGERTEKQGHELNLLGMCKGASDLFIAKPNKTYSGLWLEVKRNKIYTPSEMKTQTWIDQEKFQDRMKSVGFDAHFCYGLEHAISIIESYLSIA